MLLKGDGLLPPLLMITLLILMLGVLLLIRFCSGGAAADSATWGQQPVWTRGEDRDVTGQWCEQKGREGEADTSIQQSTLWVTHHS